MDMSVFELKENLLLNNCQEKQKGDIIDLILFILLLLSGAVYSVLSLLLLPFIPVYTIYVFVKKKSRVE
jgi:cytochrome c biogenesis protein CcdA